jgi:curved DNA-binding protein CbpA
MAVKSYYAILGVNQTDDGDAIKKAYRRLAKQYHPDLNPGDKAAEERFKDIGEAWETLGDTDKRRKYDEELSGGQKQKPFAAPSSKAPSSNRPMTQEDFFRMQGAFDSIFSEASIKDSASRKARANPKNPLDTSAFFEHVMGFKRPKK